MRLALRRTLLFSSGLIYLTLVAYLRKDPLPVPVILSRSTLSQISIFSPEKSIKISKDNFESWIEPVEFHETYPNTINEEKGLYYITKNSHYYNSNTPNSYSDSSNYELMFADRIPGSIVYASLDRSREINPSTLQVNDRRLALLYKLYSNEDAQYYVRIYNLDKTFKSVPEKEFKLKSEYLSYSKENVTVSNFVNSKICPGPEYSFFNFEKVFSHKKFKFCSGRENSKFIYGDYILPGSSEFTSFSIRNNKIVYSRKDDIYYFRTIEIPSKISNSSPISLSNSPLTTGPLIKGDYEISTSLKTNILATTRSPNLDVLQIDSILKKSKYYFWTKLIQNISTPDNSSSDFFSGPKSLEEWDIANMIKYSLGVGENYNRLNELEKYLISKSPIVEQVPRTLVCYLYITQVLLTVDTIWDEKNGQVENQYQVVHAKPVERLNSGNYDDITRLSVDDSGTILVVSKINGDLSIFKRGGPLNIDDKSLQYLRPNSKHQEVSTKPKNAPSIENKSLIRKLDKDSNNTLIWKPFMNWASGSYSTSDLWADEMNENNSGISGQINYFHPNLVGINTESGSINYLPKPAYIPPDQVGDYFVSLRVYNVFKDPKTHYDELKKSPNKKTSNLVNIIKNGYEHISFVFPILRNISSIAFSGESSEDALKDDNSNQSPSRPRIALMQRDGRMIILSLDNSKITQNWFTVYIQSKADLVLTFFITVLVFIYNESKFI
ncbi:hypothetical protein AYI68_g5169 [Smittium mucronatum]|uniref:Uncharacterized protein n=1 Tax=Smittium mucronatum TaxID=133383 RepID=A0A1R0GV25_9FUNG|nr:hypothetical protein AYI68_g5169 [Smittium mucronatum]